MVTQFYNKISGTFIISRTNLTLTSYKYKISTRSSAKPVDLPLNTDEPRPVMYALLHLLLYLFICLLEFLYEGRDCPLQQQSSPGS